MSALNGLFGNRTKLASNVASSLGEGNNLIQNEIRNFNVTIEKLDLDAETTDDQSKKLHGPPMLKKSQKNTGQFATANL